MRAWTVRNCFQVGPARRGAGSIPARCRIFHTVLAATCRPSLASSPWIRRCPQVGFSAARRSTSARICGSIAGRPGRAWGYVQCRASSWRCQRSRVAGVTKNADQRSRGSSRDRAASTTRSSGRSSGRCTCRRRTATWWRSTSSSTSLAPPSRASWVNICRICRMSRYTSEALMAGSSPSLDGWPRTNPHVNAAGRVREPHRFAHCQQQSDVCQLKGYRQTILGRTRTAYPLLRGRS